MSTEFENKGTEPLISVYRCFSKKATYSALFIHCPANIIHIAGEAGGGEGSSEKKWKVVENV